MFLLSILLISWCLGTVLKALFKSIVVKRVLKAEVFCVEVENCLCDACE